MVTDVIPLEDELGDVLDKALRHAGVTVEALGREAGVDPARIRDAVDYRYDLSCAELRRLAAALGLNEVGLCALGENRYPLPEIAGLPVCLHALRMPFGLGLVNAYVVADCATGRGVLFDCGADFDSLEKAWPRWLKNLEAVFLTHAGAEHIGGLRGVLDRHPGAALYHPRQADGEGWELGEGERVIAGPLEITALSTPGHSAEHNCYAVRPRGMPAGRALLVSGDLIFAGSLGGGYFSPRQLLAQSRRILDLLPEDTVIAPGHGPLTTVGHERRYNPFIV